ncbi:hypothetical protein [Bradyrhizobium sp. CB3481]|uniref:hypothetical protein n=1 Tax=Bradyrhizobium sp. CB3481 TaxID=3039158 RepID=UPI0024B0584C|nr:hypothetical protein [Bradyrhizobium sp. CB3481]WFU14824.1 hypothetical protein QA643_27745 [Bradyrhizobium sp. CB3481]
MSIDLPIYDEFSVTSSMADLAHVIVYATGKLFSDVSCRIVTYVRQRSYGMRCLCESYEHVQIDLSDHRALPRAIAAASITPKSYLWRQLSRGA